MAGGERGLLHFGKSNSNSAITYPTGLGPAIHHFAPCLVISVLILVNILLNFAFRINRLLLIIFTSRMGVCFLFVASVVLSVKIDGCAGTKSTVLVVTSVSSALVMVSI